MAARRNIQREAGRRYLRKAEQFIRNARDARARGDWDGVGLGAVHAGISAADAYLAWVHGVRITSKDHMRSVSLLGEIGGVEVAGRVNALARLVKQKSMVEYDDRLFTEREAEDSLRRAERLVAWAREAILGPAKR